MTQSLHRTGESGAASVGRTVGQEEASCSQACELPRGDSQSLCGVKIGEEYDHSHVGQTDTGDIFIRIHPDFNAYLQSALIAVRIDLFSHSFFVPRPLVRKGVQKSPKVVSAGTLTGLLLVYRTRRPRRVSQQHQDPTPLLLR